MSVKRVLPPYIYCVRCGKKVSMYEDRREETKEVLRRHGYVAMARGVCECGVVYVLCYQPLPASPTFSLFFDVYTPDVARKMLISLETAG